MSSERDRELLELAARAAGIEFEFDSHAHCGYYSDWRGLPQWNDWNPLTDDGDALRLAVKLRIQVTPGTYDKDKFTAFNPSPYETCVEYWSSPQDELAATRRAITRAAAAFAKGEGKV